MPTAQLDQASQPQQERLAYIEFRLLFIGCINRSDLVHRFGLTESAASRDLALYRQIASPNIGYDTVHRTYRLGARAKPLFNYNPAQALIALTEGFGDDFVAQSAPWLPAEQPSRRRAPSIQVLMPICRALFSGKAINIRYGSLSKGFEQRTIVPLTLVDDGLKWLLRAFENDSYIDLALNRIAAVSPAKTIANAKKLREQDSEWHQRIELELVPHPSLTHPEVIELEYGMKDGVLQVQLQAALAGYLLSRWNVDCTTDHHLQGPKYQLWLRNSGALQQAEQLPKLALAPGSSAAVIMQANG
ncbi:WYL domain-containing protein [Pseudomaricurvus alkylphenolicus]|uniref:WYL domain-containing protein n=1 Tax=Pseudomaricurvus alkylphenolicus TaxID=1306991 RepID=UPI00141FAB79|nr:WYL domain-containing protein [Pseudomaricurvus alkylphenolicus]NIB39085.1 WYL domain-containing protein [Pseudomaricurvus alkylphenolicus]